MKNWKQLNVMAFIAIITFAFIGCSNDTTTPETFTVTFNANGESPTPPLQTVEKGAKATEPTAPTKTSFDFIGWYTEEALTNQWNFAADTVTANITLWAKWSETPKKQPDTVFGNVGRRLENNEQ